MFGHIVKHTQQKSELEDPSQVKPSGIGKAAMRRKTTKKS